MFWLGLATDGCWLLMKGWWWWLAMRSVDGVDSEIDVGAVAGGNGELGKTGRMETPSGKDR
jgi:hypothetical protein